MKTLLTSLVLLCCVLANAQSDAYHILIPKDEITMPIINQLKSFNDYEQGKFMQDDTSTLRQIVFQHDTTKTYVILSWEGEQEPTSIASDYHLDSVSIEYRIFTDIEIRAYINENEFIGAPISNLIELE